MKKTHFIAGLLVALAALAGWAYWQHSQDAPHPDARAREARRPGEATAPTHGGQAERPAWMEQLAERAAARERSEPGEQAAAEELEGWGEPDEPDEEQPPIDRISYRVDEKYLEEDLSSVPHQVLGAWDADRDNDRPGSRRSFILIVDPDISDADLEELARDLHHEYSSAEMLDVRIYDDADAATIPRRLDGGRAAEEHMVAVVRRSSMLDVDVIRVRGEEINP